MTKNMPLTEGAAVEIQAESDRFDHVSMALHWLTVILIVTQFSSVWSLKIVDEKSALGLAILSMHRSSGVLVWVVGLARLVWRHNFAYLPPFPKTMPKLQQTIAKVNEYSLYVLLLIQPITGLGRGSAARSPIYSVLLGSAGAV